MLHEDLSVYVAFEINHEREIGNPAEKIIWVRLFCDEVYFIAERGIIGYFLLFEKFQVGLFRRA